MGRTGSAVERDDLVRPLLDAGELFFGEFHCPSTDELWSQANNIGAVPHVVFPLRTVVIERAAYGPVCADRNSALVYAANEEYRRRIVDPAGDGCAFVALTPRLLAELTQYEDPSPVGYLPVPPDAWLGAQSALVRARYAGDPLAVEELLVVSLGTLLGQRTPASASPPALRERIEAAKQLLGRDLHATLSVAALARSLYISPYHLARQFRRFTGRTIHAYRTSLRLRAATQALLDSPSVGLSEVAEAYGFASHSHFTSRFTAAFGLTPTLARRQLCAVSGLVDSAGL